jgi:hypothetical protein
MVDFRASFTFPYWYGRMVITKIINIFLLIVIAEGKNKQ